MHIQIYKFSVVKKNPNIICCVVCMQLEVSTDQIKTERKKNLYFEVHCGAVQEVQPLLPLADDIY